MVYSGVLTYLFAAGIIFLTIFVTAPMVYTIWFDNLRLSMPDTPYGNSLKGTGDLFFSSYKILGYLVVGVVIAYGFAVAARKGVQENVYQEDF